MDSKSKKEILYSLLLITIPVVTLFTIYFATNHSSEVAEHNDEGSTETIVASKPELKQNPFDGFKPNARAVVVKDLNTGEILYQKNANQSLPLASLTKIMTALVTKIYSDNTRNFEVTISPEALSKDGESNLYYGEKFKLNQLLNFTLISSSNDGAAAIAEAVQNIKGGDTFTQKMNYTAKQIGMKNSNFLNETGLDESETLAGSFGSANDVATLFEYTLKHYPEIFDATREESYATYSQYGLLHQASNTNKIIGQLPNLLASKTGYTDIAGGNLAIIVDPALNRPVVIVVLGSTTEGRFEEVKEISDKLTEYFAFSE